MSRKRILILAGHPHARQLLALLAHMAEVEMVEAHQLQTAHPADLQDFKPEALLPRNVQPAFKLAAQKKAPMKGDWSRRIRHGEKQRTSYQYRRR